MLRTNLTFLSFIERFCAENKEEAITLKNFKAGYRFIEQGEKIAISFDGNWVAFSTNATNIGAPAANIVLHNMTTKQNRAVSSLNGSSVGKPTMSYTGAYIVFGIGGKLDGRYTSSGIFANYTGLGPCHSCPN